MQISPVSDRSIPNFWNLKELPPAPLMSADSPWVKMLEKIFPKANLKELRENAHWLMNNTMKMLSHQIARDTKKNRETAQRRKDAIQGR
ncbi:MAG TPA: hypothetical protein VHK67_02645 [Rhabdochlamydiaceae bacterium]|nr:hypothetical protein [Rhabdochlamydiaceae bacterium]